MALQSLLLSRDETALATLCAALSELQFEAEVCGEREPAVALLASREFDTVVVDCDDFGQATGLLRSARLARSSKQSIVLAVVNGTTTMQAAFDEGANMVLSKPLSPEAVARSLRTAKGLVLRMGRRSLRLVVAALAYVSFDGLRDQAIILDISEGGMAVQALEQVEANRAIHLSFELPGHEAAIEATGEIAWADASGRAGIRFAEISEAAQQQVKEWLFLNALLASCETRQSPREAIAVPDGRDYAQGFEGGLASINVGGQESLDTAAPRGVPAARLEVRQRVLAACVDGLMVLAGNVMFALIVLIFSRTLPQSRLALPVGLAVPCFFWTAYQCLFLAHPRGTPGMRVAQRRWKLEHEPQVLSVVGSYDATPADTTSELRSAQRARLSPITISPRSAERGHASTTSVS